MNQDAQESQDSTDDDRTQFGQVKAMDIAALEQDGGGDMHEDADHKRHEWSGVIAYGGVGAQGQAQRSHDGEESEQAQGPAPAHATLEQHAQESNGNGVIMQDDTPQQQAAGGGIIMRVLIAERHRLDQSVEAQAGDNPEGHPAVQVMGVAMLDAHRNHIERHLGIETRHDQHPDEHGVGA